MTLGFLIGERLTSPYIIESIAAATATATSPSYPATSRLC
jgi:hypothetical protein